MTDSRFVQVCARMRIVTDCNRKAFMNTTCGTAARKPTEEELTNKAAVTHLLSEEVTATARCNNNMSLMMELAMKDNWGGRMMTQKRSGRFCAVRSSPKWWGMFLKR